MMKFRKMAGRVFHNIEDFWLTGCGYLMPSAIKRLFPRLSIPSGLFDPFQEEIDCDSVPRNQRVNHDVEIERIYKPELLDDPCPLAVDGIRHWRFDSVKRPIPSPAAYNIIAYNGKIFFGDPAVMTREGRLILNATYIWQRQPSDHRIFDRRTLPTLIPLPEKSLGVVVSPGTSNYFHWMFEIVPRILMLSRSGKAIAKIYLIHDSLPFQLDTLKILLETIAPIEIKPANLTPYVTAAVPVVAGNPGLSMFPAQWVVDSLYGLFKSRATAPNREISTRIFLTRGNDDCLIEPEFGRFLESVGFAIVSCEEFSFREQVHIFASAEIVVGVHGAAFTNLVFCRAGTLVLEIFSGNYVCEHYSSIAHRRGLRYQYLVDGVPDPKYYTHERSASCLFELSKLIESVHRICSIALIRE